MEPNCLSQDQEIFNEKKLGSHSSIRGQRPVPCGSLTRSYHFPVCIFETVFHVAQLGLRLALRLSVNS